jgi:hypothetical protein
MTANYEYYQYHYQPVQYNTNLTLGDWVLHALQLPTTHRSTLNHYLQQYYQAGYAQGIKDAAKY